MKSQLHTRTGPASRLDHRYRESGQAAGIETIPLGILVFVSGMLLVINAWAVIDTRAALDSAARDYLRAYTDAETSAAGRLLGTAAVQQTLSGRTSNGRATADAVRVSAPTAPFGPCRPASVRLELDLPTIRAPFIGSLGTITVSATHTELIQPFGAAVDESNGAGPTVCDE